VLIERIHRQAATSAQRKMRAEVNRQVRSRLALPLKSIARAVSVGGPIIAPGGLASYYVQIKHELTPISDLKPRQTRKGVSFSVLKGKRTLLRGAFIATMATGHQGVFQRASTGRTRTKSKGGRKVRTWLPIKKQFTATSHGVFAQEQAREAVQRVGEEAYRSTFDRLVFAELRRIESVTPR